MKKYIIFIVGICLFLVGCSCESMMNTPTKRAEEFLNKYQKQDSEILTQLDSVISEGTDIFTDTQKTSYKDLMKKQYKDLTYTIKEETIDGDNATVTVEIEVYDYNAAINSAQQYYVANPEEFTTDDELDNSKFMDYKIRMMDETKDRVKYTLYLTLTKTDKKWTLNDITETDRQKIHGIYNS